MPRQIRETRSPVAPRLTYSIVPHASARVAGEAGAILRAMLRMLASLATAAAVAGGLAVTASGTAACRPTLGDGAGPFSQSALATPRRAKIGTGHVLHGRVLRTDCKPVSGALVVFWQAGPNGYTARGRGSV